MRPHVNKSVTLAPALTAAAAFAIVARVAVVDEPTRIDRALNDLAEGSYSRAVELMQLPLEIAGYPGAYIPLAILAARGLRKHGRRGGATIVAAACAGWLALRLTRVTYQRVRPPPPRP